MGALKSQRCARGHKMVSKNLYMRANGQRECRACSAIRITKWRRLKSLESRILESNYQKRPDPNRGVVDPGVMDKSIRVYTSLDEMKNDEYREWHKLQPYERLNAAAELSLNGYGAKEFSDDVSCSVQRTLIRI